jgi:hypothetical protein
MPDRDDISWFKQEFGGDVLGAIESTPFDLDMLAALACQETGEVWPLLRSAGLARSQVLALCVGDTLDEDRGRRAFPRTKADLIAAPDGPRMFEIARQALVDIAQHVPAYRSAASKPNKFCHGFGIFQYDLQFFKAEPDYFLQKRYQEFSESLGKALTELRHGLAKVGLGKRTHLSDFEMTCVAIAYNTGGFKPKLALKQGYFDGEKFYGERFFDYLRIARTVAPPGARPVLSPPDPGNAAIPPPTPVTATGPYYEVDTRETMLRVRSEAAISSPDPTANVRWKLPDGHVVRAVTGIQVKGFLEIETSLSGAHMRGFASTKYLKPAAASVEIPIVVPATTPPTNGIVKVYMPRRPGTITRRRDVAGAHSLNEPGQPGRSGSTPDELRGELAQIIAWLGVDNLQYRRYQPREGSTFCNIYAHDYCYLAGVYLPRVWWTPKAIEMLTGGATATPQYGDTIDEQRANDLFRWLRDFGSRFGWRQTGSATKLQLEANQGAIGLIAARRLSDGRPGHIVVVVPETADQVARRDSSGEVIAPLQSQAGLTNFRYGTGKTGWWRGEQFAESGFWLHS